MEKPSVRASTSPSPLPLEASLKSWFGGFQFVGTMGEVSVVLLLCGIWIPCAIHLSQRRLVNREGLRAIPLDVCSQCFPHALQVAIHVVLWVWFGLSGVLIHSDRTRMNSCPEMVKRSRPAMAWL